MFKAHFTDYQRPSSMYKKLSETEITKINKTQEDSLKKVLTRLKRIIDNTPRDDAAKIEEKG